MLRRFKVIVEPEAEGGYSVHVHSSVLAKLEDDDS